MANLLSVVLFLKPVHLRSLCSETRLFKLSWFSVAGCPTLLCPLHFMKQAEINPIMYETLLIRKCSFFFSFWWTRRLRVLSCHHALHTQTYTHSRSGHSVWVFPFHRQLVSGGWKLIQRDWRFHLIAETRVPCLNICFPLIPSSYSSLRKVPLASFWPLTSS